MDFIRLFHWQEYRGGQALHDFHHGAIGLVGNDARSISVSIGLPAENPLLTVRLGTDPEAAQPAGAATQAERSASLSMAHDSAKAHFGAKLLNLCN
jgi:hypothetical protein